MRRFSLINFFLLGCLFTHSNASAQEFDKRQLSMICSEQAEPRSIACDYRFGPNISVKQLTGFVNSVEVQLESKGLLSFPSSGETTSVLIVVDVSDVRRAETINKRVVPSLEKLLDQGKSHQHFGLAILDSKLQVLAPVVAGPQAAKAALREVKAQGLATELYKNILKAIEILDKTESQRRILVVASDGKAEDTSYSRGDVVQAAKQAGVSILSIGYSERPSDSAYLQTLQKLALETFGLYVDGGELQHSKGLLVELGRLELGGRVLIPATEIFGVAALRLNFSLDNGEKFTLIQNVKMSDKRPLHVKLKASVVQQWDLWLTGLVVSVLLVWASLVLLRKRKVLKLRNMPYAVLIELNAQESKYFLRGSAARLGRGKSNDIVFNNDTVSTNHAEIHRRRDGSVFVTDLSSSNGVIVNSSRVTEAQLMTGDIVEFGEVRLRYEFLER